MNTFDRWTKTGDDGKPVNVVLSEVEPGVIHITTEAMTNILRMAGFEPAGSEAALQMLREIFSNDHEESDRP